MRWTCVDVPALPLQVLVRDSPGWAGRPAAVVDRDHPQGRILQVNGAARAARVLPGMRYAPALLVCRDLHAAEMPSARVRREVDRIAALLRRHTPSVEPCREEPGVFWLNAAGLTPLHASLDAWARSIVEAVAAEGLSARVAVGFTRFGSLVGARQLERNIPGMMSSSWRVFGDGGEEGEATRGAPLEMLPVEPGLRETLARLGVRTVGEFLALPGEGVLRRFGEEAHRLQRTAAGEAGDGLDALPPEEEFRAAASLEYAETDTARLLPVVEGLLRPLAERLASRHRAAVAVELRLRLDDGTGRTESVRPAAPSRDAAGLLELVRLRLDATALPSGVTDVEVVLASVPAREEQRTLFAEKPRRDPAAAARALARIRADLGAGAVVYARLREGHLPEASFSWDPTPREGRAAAPAGAAHPPPPPSLSPPDAPAPPPDAPAPPEEPRPLVRRLLFRPRPLRSPSRSEPDGWMPGEYAQGPVVRRHGPFTVSGGWWVRRVHRDYHYLETQRGDVLWAFHDRVRRRWFLHGRVE